MPNRLSFEDFLLIAAAVLVVPYEELEQTVCVFRAQSSLAAPFARIHGVYLHPDPVEQAAICARRLIRSRPLPVGNKEIGYECMREMLVRSGYRWSRPEEDAEEIATTLKGVESGTIGEAEFVSWVRSRVTA
jgi:prophage maintenance system killer protein